jgi:hypothetical protein
MIEVPWKPYGQLGAVTAPYKYPRATAKISQSAFFLQVCGQHFRGGLPTLKRFIFMIVSEECLQGSLKQSRKHLRYSI